MFNHFNKICDDCSTTKNVKAFDSYGKIKCLCAECKKQYDKDMLEQ
jgi:hypothetical protein